MFAMGQRPPVLVGEKVLWLGSGSGLPQSGVVRWIGQLPEIGPDWAVGIELDKALPYGGIDGTWCGRVLFTCRPKHGLIVPITSTIPASKLRFIQGNCGNHQELNKNFQSSGPSSKQSVQDDVPEKSVTNDIAKPLPALRKKHHNSIKTESNVLPPSVPPRHKQSSKPVNVYNDLNRVSVKNDLPVNIQLGTVTVNDKILQNDVLIRQESFVKNISDTNNGQTKRMSIFTSRYESNYEEAVIDAIYAERRRNFARHGRSHSDSAHAVVSTSSTSTSSRREKGNSGLFSFFRWFKKEKDSVFEEDGDGNNNDDIGIPSIPASPKLIRGHSSSCGSVDTLFSTATANSFAFVHPSLYRPFGSACVPETRIASGPETETYRNRIRQRDRLRELDKNITLRKKYNLLGSDTIYRSADNLRGKYFTGNKSTDSLKGSPASKNSTFGSRKKRKAPQPPLLERKHSEYSLPSTLEHISKDKNKFVDLKNDTENRPRHRRTVSDSAKDKKAGAYCHVKGKRKAPPPPSAPLLPSDNDNSLSKVTGSSGKKKRPAPQPPVGFCSTSTNASREDIKRPYTSLTPEEKQRLIENIAKLQAHADRNNTGTPPSSPDLNVKSPHTICNDSLKLEKGFLKANKAEMQVPEVKPAPSSPVSPRPWYKRNIIGKDAGSQNGKSLEKKKTREKMKSDDWMPEVGVPRRSIISIENNRFSNIFSKANEEKRKSQISMLVNISELDREAAEIVQKEQEREKAKLAEQNAKFYNAHVNPLEPVDLSSENKLQSTENVEIPKRSSAKELISLFNAIGNVTKVTVNSAFFSKDRPSIFTKQGIEKRFSFVGEKTEEKVIVKESISQSNGYKRETVVIDTQETYLESPGIKRRRNLYNCNSTNESDVRDDTSSSSSNSDKFSQKVTIEELDDFDSEKTSKTQAMYEANRLRRHHSPSPSIPTIVEMSESVSSVTTSPGSTINNNRTVTPEPLQHAKRISFWVCPRCTLENARWRVTCDACDLWRPVQDSTNDVSGTHDVATASIIIQSVEKDKNLTKSDKINTSANSIIENNMNRNVDKIIENPLKVDSKIIGCEKKEVKPVSNVTPLKSTFAVEKQSENNGVYQKQSEKINNEADIDGLRKARIAFFDKTLDNENTTMKEISSSQEPNVSNVKLPSQPNINDLQTKATGGSSIATNEEERLKIKEMLKEIKNSLPKRQKSTSDNSKSETASGTNDTCIDKVTGNFGLHVDKEKLVSSEKIDINVNKFVPVNGVKDISVNKATNKPGLLDGQKQTPSENIRNTKFEPLNGNIDVHVDKNTSNFGSPVDPTKLGAIKKVPQPKPFVESDAKTKQNRYSISNLGTKKDEKAEAYLVKSEMILEDIKIRKPEKVSTSVQTNGVINKIENRLASNSDFGKPPVGKVTPKSNRKEFIVPVTVEEYKIKDGVLYTSLTKETKRIGTGTFELIRARDFASIEATKTGNEAVAVHVYANVPSSNTCVQEQTQWEKQPPASSVSISSETTEVEKLTAELTQPKGLADFKAKLEGNKSIAADKMNTLAVNRLLRKLETAIAGGQHHQAAVLAKDLARLKINCSVTRHKETVNANLITIDMYVEDKVSHQGPIPLQISPSLTVAQLKLKVEKEFEIPVHVQRWILDKQLAVDDKATLKQLSVDTPHCPVFLYLVAPEGGLEKPTFVKNNVQEKNVLTETAAEATNAAVALQQPEAKKTFYNGEDDQYSLCESDRTQQSSKEQSPEVELEEQIEFEEEELEEEEIEIEIEEEEEEEEIEERINRVEPPRTGTLTLGWKCPVCTLVNSPTRPGCLACTTARPPDYVVPAEYQASGAEMARLNMEEENQKEAAEEKMKHYQQLVNLENADLVVSAEPFECSICFVNYAPEEGVVLRECLHTFCKACLAHTVEFSEEAEVKCPYRDEQYACDSTLQEREIKALVPPEIYEQHLAKSVAQAENKIGNAFHCKSPDCPGWCIFEDNVNIFNCPVCGKTNCLTCQAIHNGMNCKQYQEQVNEDSETNAEARRTKEMLQEMVERGEAMNCPTCQVVLMKKWGCDWLRCSMCKTEICWVTRGPRWGPGGKGDISGGCQCGVNGIKCHPRCNYCH